MDFFSKLLSTYFCTRTVSEICTTDLSKGNTFAKPEISLFYTSHLPVCSAHWFHTQQRTQKKNNISYKFVSVVNKNYKMNISYYVQYELLISV